MHRFEYRLFMAYLDLDELPGLIERGGLFGTSKHASRSFRRADHLFKHSLPLAEEVRQIIHGTTGQLPSGPIRLLTQLRHFRWFFSPLNLFYAFDATGSEIEFVLAEVSNTPWSERHCYVLWSGNRTQAIGEQTLAFAHAKAFHVSPFMGMDQHYSWRVNTPASSLSVDLQSEEEGTPLFDAHLTMQRRELSSANLRRMTLRYPFMTAQITAAIYFQALKLWWKKCPCYPHPKKKLAPSALARPMLPGRSANRKSPLRI